MTDPFIGLMSGTSCDGLDAVLVSFDGDRPQIHAARHLAYPHTLRARLLGAALGKDEDLERAARLDVELGRLLATASADIAAAGGVALSEVRAIGSHGHTLRHRPDADPPFTLQIGDPHVIAKSTGVTTVADFRRADLALGGQGAPLACAYHAVCLGGGEARAVANIGGIANVTVLPARGEVRGYDAGPGNALMDEWIEDQRGDAYDHEGRWAAAGKVDAALLAHLLADPYFARPPPKSTGRELFSQRWLRAHLPEPPPAPEDVQATLCELTAAAVADSIAASAPDTVRVLVCGGGVHNRSLMQRLASRTQVPVCSTGEYGIDPDWVEAVAFAWFAKRTLEGMTSSLPGVTGARRPAVLGAICPP